VGVVTASPRVWPDGFRSPNQRLRPELGGTVERVVRPGLDGLVRVLWTIPKTPPSMNVWESMHWAARGRTKNAWLEYISIYSRRDSVPPSEWVYASAQIVFRRRAHRDLSNYDAVLWKIFPDVLIRAGVISDDTENEMRRGKVSLISDKRLMGVYSDPRLAGFTRIALIAKPKE
jgi:hypothetical protein